MSSAIQLPVDKRVLRRGDLNPPDFFSILGQLGQGEVTNYRVHTGSRVLRIEDLHFSLDTRVVKSFYGERDKTVYVIPRD
ncbi:hypothetical protein TIFTF001_021622 [Ficus carica]|uniref:Uncharacterized protein n=1 Tax=Ficus carica TaxID=3494 RepID=A0AA88DJU4_FICCA|nr:hypothetical protein TIFTF001_021622 [Ficus carica]